MSLATRTRVRWQILAFLFYATTVNYLDRIVFSVLIPVIEKELSLSKLDYGFLTGAFQIAYTVGFLLMGKLIDRWGTRIGYAVSIGWWSLAAVFHATARTAVSLGFWRAMLGLGEAGNFPSAIKAVAEWFPKKDRALATGIFNAGTNVASMIGPPVFVAMDAHFGWRGCFLITGALGFIWLIPWLWSYKIPEHHPRVNQAEQDYIRSNVGEEGKEPTIGWLQSLKFRQTWGFAFAKFLTDPVWWFYLYWLPPYLFDVRKFKLTEIGWALPVVYLMADLGSITGGWISGFLIRRGWQQGKARKMAMGICAGAMPIAAMAVLAPSPVAAVALVSLATAAHQGWSANLYTTTSDVFPKKAVASVTGIGGAAGGIGGVLISAVIPGYLITWFGYTPVFLAMGCFHLTALWLVHHFMGDMRPMIAPTP